MRLWQKLMIFLATHPGIKERMENTGLAIRLARRFVGGTDEQAALAKARDLNRQNLAVSFFSLGEYVTDPLVIAQTMDRLARMIHLARKADLDLHISVDPTQAGLMQGPTPCLENLSRLAKTLKPLARPDRQDLLMIDMEDSSVTQATMDIYLNLARQNLPVGVTLQSCLYRTASDLEQVLASGDMVRLVKGAFAENNAVAHIRKKDIDQAYVCLARRVFEKKQVKKEFYPVFATHDHKMIRQVQDLAAENQIQKHEYEFEMLFGVRPRLQKVLVRQGFKVRLYLPNGKDFWPYAIRRIGENPRNLKFLIRSLV